DVRSALPAPQVPAPPAPFRAPAVIPGPPAQSPPPAPVIEVPGTEIAGNTALPPGGSVPQLPPPDRGNDKGSEKPKLAFESLASASVRPQNPSIPAPRKSVQDASQAAGRPLISGSGVSVGDPLEEPPTIPFPNQMPSPGKMGSNLQL